VDDEIDALIEEIVTDAYGPAEQLWSFRQFFEDTASFPFTAKVAGAPIEMIEIDFDGDERHGLSAICEREGERHSVALLDIAPSASVTSDTRSLIDAYRRWSNAKPLAVDDSHQHTPPSTTPPDARPPSPALSSLVGDEHATVLTNLLDAHPELRDHAERLASESLSNVDIEHVAEPSKQRWHRSPSTSSEPELDKFEADTCTRPTPPGTSSTKPSNNSVSMPDDAPQSGFRKPLRHSLPGLSRASTDNANPTKGPWSPTLDPTRSTASST
jgi:Calcium binding